MKRAKRRLGSLGQCRAAPRAGPDVHGVAYRQRVDDAVARRSRMGGRPDQPHHALAVLVAHERLGLRDAHMALGQLEEVLHLARHAPDPGPDGAHVDW